MLTKLFRDLDVCPLLLLPAKIDAEVELMQVLAEVHEDKCPDDGVVEILLEDQYIG